MNSNLNRPSQRRKEMGKTVGETMVQTVGESLNSTAAKIIEPIKINPYATSKELAEGLKLTIRGIEYNLKILKDNNYIERIGANKGGYWKIL